MKATEKIWLDGKLVDWDDAKVHVLTNALHYGSGVFEGIRCYKTDKGGAIFQLDDHIDRLFYSARCLGIKITYSKDIIKEAILSLVKLNKVHECYIRPAVFYGYGNMSLDVSKLSVNVAIAVWPWGAYLGGNGVKVKISKYRRLHPDSVIIDAKISGYYASSIFATLEAKRAGFDEALFLDNEGYVAEGPGENIFVVKNGKIYTPRRDNILPGITRECVMKIARNDSIKVIEKNIPVAELKNADEVFFTGTAVEICPVVNINGRKVGNETAGPVTLKIKEEYNKIVRGQNKEYIKWLTLV